MPSILGDSKNAIRTSKNQLQSVAEKIAAIEFAYEKDYPEVERFAHTLIELIINVRAGLDLLEQKIDKL